MKMQCTNCGYECELKKSNECCPYCGERKYLAQQKDAERLVEDL